MNGHQTNILVVDTDFPTGGTGLADAAAGGDRRVTLARSDQEAVSLLLDGPDFDIALVAIDRDGISGMSLFRHLSDRRVRIPRVAVTDGGDIALIRRALAEGAVDFLVRPVGRDDFQDTVSRVLGDVERRRRNWNERAEYFALKREIDIAAEIQQRILPTDYPAVPDLDVHAGMRPAKSMGGDFYDVFECGRGRIGFAVADVSGKGVPAAFYMAVARTLLRSIGSSGASPADCLAEVNQLLCGHQIPGMFVSCFYGVIDTKTFRIDFANGGHPPPMVGDGQNAPSPLQGGEGTVLGITPDVEYGEGSVTLTPGGFLYLYTDGVSEALNRDREQFSEERISEVLAEARHLDAAALSQALIERLDIFVGAADPHDDITSLVIRRRE